MFVELTVSSAAGGQHGVLVNAAAITDIQPGEGGTVIHLVNGRQLVVDEAPAVVAQLLEQADVHVVRQRSSS
jgi:hypothetical protein